MQKRCSIFIMPQQRSGSSLRTFFVSTWTAYWFTHHVRLLMREHFQLVMNKLLNVSDLTNGTFNFVCEVSSSPTSKFVCLLDLLALLWCILWTQSIALKGAFTRMLHRFFHRHERHKHMFVNGQSSPNRFRFSILWAFCSKESVYSKEKSLPRAREVMTQKSWSIDTRHIVVLETFPISFRVDSPFVSVITFQLKPTRCCYVTN